MLVLLVSLGSTWISPPHCVLKYVEMLRDLHLLATMVTMLMATDAHLTVKLRLDSLVLEAHLIPKIHVPRLYLKHLTSPQQDNLIFGEK